MSLMINGERYEEGDQVAVTFVGNVSGDTLQGPGISLYVGNSLRFVADAYLVEPEVPKYEPGTLVRAHDGRLFVALDDGQLRSLLGRTGRPTLGLKYSVLELMRNNRGDAPEIVKVVAA